MPSHESVRPSVRPSVLPSLACASWHIYIYMFLFMRRLRWLAAPCVSAVFLNRMSHQVERAKSKSAKGVDDTYTNH